MKLNKQLNLLRLLLLLVLIGTWSSAVAAGGEPSKYNQTTLLAQANARGGGPVLPLGRGLLQNSLSGNTSVTIKIKPAPTTTIVGSQSVCIGSTEQYSAADGMASYAWTVTGGGVVNGPTNGQSVSVTWPTAGAGTVAVSYAGANGCSSVTSINIAVGSGSAGGTINGSTAVCAGINSATLTLVGNTGAVVRWESTVSPFTAWTTVSGSVGLSFITATNLNVTTKYRAVVQSAGCGQVISNEAVISVNPLPVASDIISTSSTTPVCRGATSTLTAATSSADISIEWYADAALTQMVGQGPAFTTGRLYSDTAFYALPINTTTGCRATAASAVAVHVSVQYSTHTDYARVCQYSEYTWRGIKISTDTAGSYIYHSTRNNPSGCDSLYILDINVLAAPAITLAYSTSHYNDVLVLSPVTLTATPPYYDKYKFILNSAVVSDGRESEVTAESPLYYKRINSASVEVADAEGCNNKAAIRFELNVVMPNVFQPNGDGYNDIFLKGYDLKIFNRYGHVLYTGTNGWDGKYNGQDMPTGTYFYEVKLTTGPNSTEAVAGSVRLER